MPVVDVAIVVGLVTSTDLLLLLISLDEARVPLPFTFHLEHHSYQALVNETSVLNRRQSRRSAPLRVRGGVGGQPSLGTLSDCRERRGFEDRDPDSCVRCPPLPVSGCRRCLQADADWKNIVEHATNRGRTDPAGRRRL